MISGSDVLQAEAEREENVNMCTALERLAEENRQRGIAQGRCEERDVTVKALLLQGLLPEQKIAEAVNISMEELQEIKERMIGEKRRHSVEAIAELVLVPNMRVLRIKAVENLLERLEDKIMKNSETDKEGKKAKNRSFGF